MDRTPATGVDVRIHEEGYTVSHWGVSLSVASEDVGGAKWRRHVHGATRETEFGTETIVVNGRKTEEFLTVVERQGEKTWRWKLASRLYPRLGRDGSVTFLDPTRHQVTSISIDPVRILDGEGKDITPEGLRWDLEEGNLGWFLTLKLDDADLPLPYVIDPAVTHRHLGDAEQRRRLDEPRRSPSRPARWRRISSSPTSPSAATGRSPRPAGWTQVVNAEQRLLPPPDRLVQGRRRLRAGQLHLDVRHERRGGGRHQRLLRGQDRDGSRP